nr:MucBP domain-containing protein [Clostridia bacterium]
MNRGAKGLHRFAVFLLTAMLLITTCLSTAHADIWSELMIYVLWTDAYGDVQKIPAQPVMNSAERAYWANVDASALGQTLQVEAHSPTPDAAFFFEDEFGGHTTSFTWTDEMDAQGLDAGYAYPLLFTVNGQMGDMPIYLYVSSVPMPQEEQFAPFVVQVPVKYMAEDGTLLDSDMVGCWAGESTPVWAASSNTAGYQLISQETVNVTVDRDGNASPREVVFTYREMITPTPVPTEEPTPAPVAEVSFPVAYMHENGDTLDFQEITLAPGTHPVYPDSRKVGDYDLVSDSAVYVTVHPDGSVEPQSAMFTYKDAYKAPAQAVVTVYYKHENGKTLDVQDVTLQEGVNHIGPTSARVEGYELLSHPYAEVTVYADGSASTASVTFTYRDAYAAPVQAEVAVNYIHAEYGLLYTETLILPEGVHTVQANPSYAQGFSPVYGETAEVTVFADGTTHPGTVDFYYEDAYTAPVTAKLTIIYQLADGTVITREAIDLPVGSHTILPDAAKAAPYQLDGDQMHVVQVDERGVIDQEVVSFLCKAAAVKIAVHYQDDRGRDVAPVQTLSFENDGDYVIKAEPVGLSDEYELAPGLHTEVPVSIISGVPSQSDVYFYYQLRQAEARQAVVTVRFFDTYGVEIVPAQSITLNPGIHHLTADDTHIPAGYELVSDASITVEVYENGTFSPQEVAFYYREAKPEEKTVSITVHYRDDRGKEVASSQVRKLGEGRHTITPEPQDLLPGYALFEAADTAVDVIVRNGTASRNQVVFYYKKTAVEPTVFKLPVYYYDTMGKPVATTQYVEVAAGTYTIQANPADLPKGYELMMEEKLPVTVFADGKTEPEEIAFYYRAPEKTATVIVRYVDENNRSILEPFAMELSAGYYTIEADASRVPVGYDPASAQPVQVYVSREGTVNPSQVTLVFARQVRETPIPVGQHVYRYATVTGSDVAMRSEPSTSRKDTVLRRIPKGAKVYVLQESYNHSNEVWALVNVDGTYGYMMSKFLDVMTQVQSDAYAAGSTPAPTFTPVPTATAVPTASPSPTPTYEPTQAPIELITPPPVETPTLEPLPLESATPTASPSPAPYTGYALTARATALRTGISSSDMTIIQSMAANELVRVIDQRPDPMTGEMWAIVSTLNKQAGFVQSSALRPITDKEAEPYLLFWEELNKSPEPTQLVTATPEPPQMEGYGVVLGDDVPFRQMASEYSRIIDNMDAGTIVYITGQMPSDGQYWHSVNYEGYWGYIRADLVRMLTLAEEEDYLDRINNTPTPEPVTTNLPFDEHGLSSYGYVDGSSVNWRQSPSMKAPNVEGKRELKRYAFCLVLGSERVSGVTWYHVSYGDKTGYIHGDFFKQMTIAELSDFLGSEEYLQGVANNAASGDSAMDDVGFTGTGGIVSAEDQWVNKNPDVYASFAPFNPIGTPAPIATATPTLEPLPGWATAAPTATPSPTPTFNPLPNVTYPTNDDGQGGSAILWVVVIGLLLLAVGGVFALVRYQQNKRRIAMRAAQRRAQAARAQQMQRPYARTSAPNQPRTGAYPNQQTPVRRPVQGGDTSQYAPYSGQYGRSSFRRPPESPANDQPQRVGRRTAYRQAQQNQQNDEGNFDA